MYELFFQAFQQKIALTENEVALIKDHLMPKKLRKKQYLLQEGDICKSFAFVEKGALRSYTLDEAGGEHIMQFALEGWLIADLSSFLTGEPADYNIDALQDSELVLITRKVHDELLLTMPKYGDWFRIQITNAYIALQRRINAAISLTVEERYNKLTSLYPDIVQRVPQHMIASYMGLTPETLSRARKRISAK
jgi:CRP-like cAMP-binding protein